MDGQMGRWMNRRMDGPTDQQGELPVPHPPQSISVMSGPSIPEENNA